LPRPISPTIRIPHVGSSGSEADFPTRVTGSLDVDPTISPTLLVCTRRIIRSHLNPETQNLSELIRRCFSSVGSSGCIGRIVRPWGCRIIRSHCVFPISLLHLSNSSQRSFEHSKYIRFDISTVGWTSRLDGALDVLSRRCIGRLGYCLDSIQGT